MPTVKTAISLDQNLFEKVNDFAENLHVSRSRLFVLAIEDFIKKKEDQILLEKLNNAYNDFPDEEESTKQKQMIQKQRLSMKDIEW
ncbi:MAG: CopG family transcriptional regulator [SAR324 cluster bacterium]|nr:CopG family transcriptional regulator [SAR324 cluster bacterium]